MTNYKGYTRKELNTVISNYLINCIPDTATIQAEYNKEVITNKDRVNFAMADFERVANYDSNKRRFPNIQDRLADFLQGLPNTLEVEYRNHAIIELAKLWGSIPENATEKTEDKIIANWFNFIAFKFLQLHRNINTPAKIKGKKYFASFNHFELILTKEIAQSCNHSGACDNDVNAALQLPEIYQQLDALNPENLRKELSEYGAWSDTELQNKADNYARILWIAAGNVCEENNF